MITRAHLATFERFGGDLDGYVRVAKRSDPDPVSDEEWYLIQGLLQDLALGAGGLASARFAERAEQRLREAAADAGTVEAMQALARRQGLGGTSGRDPAGGRPA